MMMLAEMAATSVAAEMATNPPVTLKSLRRSERAVERARALVDKRQKMLAGAVDLLDDALAVHAALVEAYRIESTEA